MTPAQRSAFQSRRLVEAVKLLGQQGYRSDQTLFIRALSDAVTTQPDRILATERATGKSWSLIHGITRQESSFDRAVVSGANAMGMMQLLPGTGR